METIKKTAPIIKLIMLIIIKKEEQKFSLGTIIYCINILRK
jgi:hypothetical protein